MKDSYASFVHRVTKVPSNKLRSRIIRTKTSIYTNNKILIS
mgnify:CR=1 FL=1|jgi:hypothetical protein